MPVPGPASIHVDPGGYGEDMILQAIAVKAGMDTPTMGPTASFKAENRFMEKSGSDVFPAW